MLYGGDHQQLRQGTNFDIIKINKGGKVKLPLTKHFVQCLLFLNVLYK